MFNPYAYMFYEGLYRTYGIVAHVYGFFRGRSNWPRLLTTVRPHNRRNYCEQDIQLVVSDPKACNDIIVKDQAIFEETEVFLLYVIFSPSK